MAERILKERDLNEKFEHRIDYQLMKVNYILLTDKALSLFLFLFYQTNLKFQSILQKKERAREIDRKREKGKGEKQQCKEGEKEADMQLQGRQVGER